MTLLFMSGRNTPTTGGGIHNGRGVWLGSNAIILGLCTIGDHTIFRM